MGAWLKKWWWVLLLALSTVVAGIIAVWALFRKEKQPPPLQTFSAQAREKIVEAETDLKISRLKADADKKEQEAKLEAIEKIDDGAERRRRLADYLNDNL